MSIYSHSPVSFPALGSHTVQEVLASERQEKELKVTRTGEEESELLLFKDVEKKNNL